MDRGAEALALNRHPKLAELLSGELAIPPLEFSVSKSPQNPEYLYHLGLAYAKAGRAADAEKVLRNALRIKSDFQGADDARQTLASLK